MLLTITLILVAMLALAALELWLFWRVGGRDDRRRAHRRRDVAVLDTPTAARRNGPRRPGSPPVRPAA